MIKFYCSSCRKKLGVPDEYAGRRVRCPKCNQPSIVPGTDASGAVAAEVSLQPEPPAPAPSETPTHIKLDQIPENPHAEILRQYRLQQASDRTRCAEKPSVEKEPSSQFERFGSLGFILNPIIRVVGTFPLAIIASVVVSAAVIMGWNLLALAVGVQLEVFYVVVAVAAGIGLCIISDHRGVMMGILALFMGMLAMVAGRITQVHLFIFPEWNRVVTASDIPPDREKLYLMMRQISGKRGNDSIRREIAQQDTEMPTIAICTLIQDEALEPELGLELHFAAKARLEQTNMSLEAASKEMTFDRPELTEAWPAVAALLQEWDTLEKRIDAVRRVHMRYVFFNEQAAYKILLDDYVRAITVGFFICKGGCIFLFLRVLYWIVGLIGAYKTCSVSFMD